MQKTMARRQESSETHFYNIYPILYESSPAEMVNVLRKRGKKRTFNMRIRCKEVLPGKWPQRTPAIRSFYCNPKVCQIHRCQRTARMGITGVFVLGGKKGAKMMYHK
ncbi:uncharacterized protein TM35_000361120 [Trypanosoma theileri]|uniref:Uncharacterized protein n=1 Tax=Trypanosoma theileri TaxID=67003 RepID=A0A1X0NKG1_9TRYP|nr:uncharacterized protein TM35_000361120 [Trypanosoma theileri]ORC85252.1 hypothetical protein TM35_000361120 [Trypanosoma theileri]